MIAECVKNLVVSVPVFLMLSLRHVHCANTHTLDLTMMAVKVQGHNLLILTWF